jgi:hypothetical protein
MRNEFVRALLLAGGALTLAGFAQPVAAKAVSRPDFQFPTQGTLKVAVFRPDVHVGSLKLGGVNQPNAEWTETARANLETALKGAPEFKDSQITFVDELQGEQAGVLEGYRGLFELVADSMFQHVTTRGNILPTKQYVIPPVPGDKFRTSPEMASRIDWTLGDGATKLRDITGADYAMFVYTNDAYGDAGRKAAQAMGMLGCLVGFCVIMKGGVHIGYSGLVDLRTGNVVWFNTDLSIGGDVRQVDGAAKRVTELMAGFPTRSNPTGKSADPQ